MVVVPARQATHPGGIGSLESILGLLTGLKIRAKKPLPGQQGLYSVEFSLSRVVRKYYWQLLHLPPWLYAVNCTTKEKCLLYIVQHTICSLLITQFML
jgi:hypothetical protein